MKKKGKSHTTSTLISSVLRVVPQAQRVLELEIVEQKWE